VLLALYPFLFASYGITLGNDIVIYSILALALDLCWGVTGIISIGHAAFFGLGAYVVGVLNAKHGDHNGILLLLAAMAASGLVAGLVGLFLFTGRNDVGIWYVALATIALSYGAQQLAAGTSEVGADSGLPYIDVKLPFIAQYGTRSSFYALLVVLGAVYVVLRAALSTRIGLLLRAIREDSARVAYFGYRVALRKVGIFAVSGAVAGLAGGLLAVSDGFVAPNMLGVELSTLVVLWVLIGGPGVLIGAVVGAGVLQFASFRLSDSYQTGWQIALGVLVIAFVALAPGGLVGLLEQGWTALGRVRGRRTRVAEVG
jgi:branched-chain amino acid transport system permease protein